MLFVETLIIIIAAALIFTLYVHKKRKLRNIKLKQFNNIKDPYEFEIFVGEILKTLGYKVVRTRKSRDFGADILLKKGKRKIVIQVKFWKNKVGEEALKEVIASSYVYGARECAVITNSHFSSNVIDLSKKLIGKGHLNRVILIDGDKLRRIVEGRRLL